MKKKSRKPSGAPPLVKGYLPVRLKLPPSSRNNGDIRTDVDNDGGDGVCSYDESFFFVKEHRSNEKGSNKTNDEQGKNKKGKENNTLFVSNAPVVPFVKTKLLLGSIFGRYGDVARVTVIPHPRQRQTTGLPPPMGDGGHDGNEPALSWTDNFASSPSFLKPVHSEGKFAHVVFTSNKEMKKSLRVLGEVMTPSSSSSDPPGLSLDRIEIQTLADESDRQYLEEHGMTEQDGESDGDSDGGGEEAGAKPPAGRRKRGRLGKGRRGDGGTSAVAIVAERYKKQCDRYARRNELLEECNKVMEDFEDEEERDRRAREAASNQPDEDGFVTVTYSSQVGSKTEMEAGGRSGGGGGISSPGRRRKGQGRRSRGAAGGGAAAGRNGNNADKKNKLSGASELSDFYRFQTKENRKRTVHELRRRFEEDLIRVKKMKDDRAYRPF